MAIISSGRGHPDTLPVSTCDKPALLTNNKALLGKNKIVN